MTFPPYPTYKDSGIEWLGEVPEHWSLSALKRIACLRSGDTINSECIEDTGEYPVYGGNGLRGYTNTFTHDGLYPLIGRQGALCGNINYANGKFWASEHAVVVSPVQAVVQCWLGELLRAMNLNQHSVSAAQPGLSVEIISNLTIPIPPLPEQSAITAFLDRETTKIDALVTEQQRLIELLKEKRQAVISHAVTKGLNPAAPMKDSGIEWLGEVPEHWGVKRARFVVQMNPSKVEIVTLDRDADVSFLPMEAIGDNGKIELERTRSIKEVESGYTYFRNGDVTIAKITPCFENGKGAVMQGLIGGIGFGTTELIVVRPRPTQSISSYLFWLFTSVPFRKLGEASMYGAGGQKRVPDDFVKDFAIAFPPLPEQSAIASFLDNETAKIDTLIAEANHAIELLKERRSALISAAVTGKIDVRGMELGTTMATCFSSDEARAWRMRLAERNLGDTVEDVRQDRAR
ncbi:MAG: restriction endonuclease subunit S [Magnetococcales bacterium]|nr:restriction endonuclease subunit S [Magnetococcales bacterium]